MISRADFETKFIKMVTLCGFTFQKKNWVDYYDSLQHTDERTLLLAFKEMTEDPPSKLNLKNVKSFISIVKKQNSDGIAAAWNGSKCSHPDCIEGLIITKHQGNSYLWKCGKCRSYDCKSYEYCTPENVEKLELKLAKQFKTRPDFVSDSKLYKKPVPVKTDIKSILKQTLN